ncbi:MAG: MATE family efflux transporter [Paludibacteraceae bacterium]|nr:MATE family efflux transporter [Paludibacteraceae bacterium]
MKNEYVKRMVDCMLRRKTDDQQMRSGKVVVRSMLSTQVACVLNYLAPQLAIFLNSMMVSQFLGVDSFKATAAFNPIAGVIMMLINLCNLGPSLQAGTAYGKLDFNSANKLLTFSAVSSAFVAIISAIVILTFRGGIAGMMTSDPAVLGNLYSYLAPMAIYFLFDATVSVMNAYVTAAGHAEKVTRATFVSVFVNIISVFLLIKVAHLGIESVGIAMCLSSASNILVLLPVVFSKDFPFRFVTPALELLTMFGKNILLWTSVISASISNAIFQFLVNILVLYFLPSDGLFVWGVCLQAISMPLCFTAGVADAYLYVDAFLLGEGDSAGRLRIAKAYFLEICLILMLFTFVYVCFTDNMAMLFGAKSIELIHSVRMPLMCVTCFFVFRDLLTTFGVFSIQLKPSIKVMLDVITCLVPPLMIMVAAITLGNGNLWYGFVATAVVIAIYVAVVNAICCHKDKNLVPYFLLDRYSETVNLDVSVNYTLESLEENMERIRLFLSVCEVSEDLSKRIEICCEELMNNIIGTKNKKGTFDIRLSEGSDNLCLFATNLGKPVSPAIPNNLVEEYVENGRIPDVSELSLFYINSYSDKQMYHYVHGMNILYLQFDKK